MSEKGECEAQRISQLGIKAMSYKEHLVVVTTYEIADSPDKPSDAVIGSQYWHIGDKDWNNTCHASVEELIYEYVKEDSWRLLQWTVLDKPHAHELIFACPANSFFETPE
jgi:hypothetical protein